MIIIPTFDTTTSTINAPVGFFAAVQEACTLVAGKFTGNNLSMTIQFGYGSVANSVPALTSSGAQSEFFLLEVGSGTTSLSTLKSGLLANARTTYATIAANSVPTITDPTSGGTMWITYSQAWVLGIQLQTAGTLVGYVGLNSGNTYFWTKANGAQSGYDAVGMFAHEITEVMGRDGFKLSSFSSTTAYYPFDLFSYTAPGTRSFTSYAASYISHDGGITNLNTTSTAGSGDTMDMNGATIDSFNSTATVNVLLPMTISGIIMMDALGYQAGPLYAVSASGVGKGF